MRAIAVPIVGALVAIAFVGSHVSPGVSGAVARSVADRARPAEDRRSDPLRKPQQTLALAGVRSGMIVGEFYPGGGYFTRMLSDLVGKDGHVYGIENSRWKGSIKADKALLAQNRWKNVTISAEPFGTVNFPRPLDLAWVTQNYHDMKIAKEGKVDTLAFDRAVYKALKPGGIYFIVDHQGAPGLTGAQIGKLHRINRDLVVKEVTSAGFRLIAEGSFLHNPGDDHSKPIFDKSIRGHTDQYALKFLKPEQQHRSLAERIVAAIPVLIQARD